MYTEKKSPGWKISQSLLFFLRSWFHVYYDFFLVRLFVFLILREFWILWQGWHVLDIFFEKKKEKSITGTIDSKRWWNIDGQLHWKEQLVIIRKVTTTTTKNLSYRKTTQKCMKINMFCRHIKISITTTAQEQRLNTHSDRCSFDRKRKSKIKSESDMVLVSMELCLHSVIVSVGLPHTHKHTIESILTYLCS